MWPFPKNCERIQKFRKTSNLNHIYENELDKACFAQDAAYSDSKDLAKTTISDKILKDRAYQIAINPKYDGYQRGFAMLGVGFASVMDCRFSWNRIIIFF